MLTVRLVLPVFRFPFSIIRLPLVIGFNRSMLRWPLISYSVLRPLNTFGVGILELISTSTESVVSGSLIVLNLPQVRLILKLSSCLKTADYSWDSIILLLFNSSANARLSINDSSNAFSLPIEITRPFCHYTGGFLI